MSIDAKLIKKATGFKTVSVKSCDSTFDDIGANDVIIARGQKHGKGRGEHTFYSPDGGIYIVMRERGLNIDAHTLTPAVGLAVHDSLLAVLGVKSRLKWVNDVTVNGKKVCGILCKSPYRGEYLIGVGINYATPPYALEKAGLSDAVTLMAPEEKAQSFCIDLIRRIHRAALVPFEHEKYNALCDTVGKYISFVRDGITVKGFATGVETDGTLIVRIGMATVAVDAGEVAIIRDAEPQKNEKAE